jgi:hypothetical protein
LPFKCNLQRYNVVLRIWDIFMLEAGAYDRPFISLA